MKKNKLKMNKKKKKVVVGWVDFKKIFLMGRYPFRLFCLKAWFGCYVQVLQEKNKVK